MTVETTSPRIAYTGNGSIMALAVNYAFQLATDLLVVETTIATGAQTVKAINTDYTVSGTTDGNGYYPNGGTVTTVVALANTLTWTIINNPPQTQLVQHIDGDNFPSSSIDNPLDKLTMLIQRVSDLQSRSLTQPDGDATDIGPLPPEVTRANSGAGSYAGYDANGNPTAIVGTVGTAAVSSAMAPVISSSTLASARTAMGLASGATTTVGSIATDTPLSAMLAVTGVTQPTFASTMTLNFETNVNWAIVLTGNLTLNLPTGVGAGLVDGQSGFVKLIQDGTGSRTLTLGTGFHTPGGAGITLSTAANAVDIMSYIVSSGLCYVSLLKAFA